MKKQLFGNEPPTVTVMLSTGQMGRPGSQPFEGQRPTNWRKVVDSGGAAESGWKGRASIAPGGGSTGVVRLTRAAAIAAEGGDATDAVASARHKIRPSRMGGTSWG